MKNRIIITATFAACLALCAAVWPQTEKVEKTPTPSETTAVIAPQPTLPEAEKPVLPVVTEKKESEMLEAESAPEVATEELPIPVPEIEDEAETEQEYVPPTQTDSISVQLTQPEPKSAPEPIAKVLCSEYFARINPETNEPQKIMGNFLGYLLLNRDFHISEDTPDGEQVCRSLLAYYNTGEGAEEIQSLLSEYRKAIYENDAPMEIYYVDILCAIVMVALSKSSWILLPRYSELDQSLWSDYLKSPKAPRMLWPAQQLIGEKGVLRGQSAIVQLPTGVGKTKSIELVIRSSFASGRATTAIIVAPLRALCNEIANDMISAFGDKVLVNQFSDVLEEDFSLDLFLSLKSKILICTPEKLSYIIHHQADFLDEIGLYIFDEGHMFDDGSRGAIYELLISEIRSHISLEEQLILLSAVLSNAEQIQKWLLGEAGVLASDPQIKATPKTIGFASQTKDIAAGMVCAIGFCSFFHEFICKDHIETHGFKSYIHSTGTSKQ